MTFIEDCPKVQRVVSKKWYGIVKSDKFKIAWLTVEFQKNIIRNDLWKV